MAQPTNPHDQEAESRWPEQYRESQQNWNSWSEAEQKALLLKSEAITEAIADLYLRGLGCDAEQVQQQIDSHYKWICNFWKPDAKSYSGLGELYVADPRFAANYEKYAQGLSAFMSAAMNVFANRELG